MQELHRQEGRRVTENETRDDESGKIREFYTGHDGRTVDMPVGMQESTICERAFEFGCRILELSEKLWERGPAARKEEVAWELNEAGELRAMIIAAIKTAQSSPTRGKPV